MSRAQKLFTSIVPQSWKESMEKESREWKVRCKCGYETSVWELGGIRWKAKGNKKRYMVCPSCKASSWMSIVRM